MVTVGTLWPRNVEKRKRSKKQLALDRKMQSFIPRFRLVPASTD